MTAPRLYYADAYLREFSATVINHTTHQDRPALQLSQSAFYPTSGGQPHDLGTLNGIPVLDVIADDEKSVLHILAEPLSAEQVEGRIDWQRRFDHMQHHSGQHILSRAFIELANAETVSFHLSENSVTIDLNRNDLTPAEIDAAENLANQIVTENRPIRAWFPAADELAALSLRKISEKVTGAVRVVDIQNFDTTACGGTHVAFTGEIGLIKIVRLERMKSKLTRIEFMCGQRAIVDYRAKNDLLNTLATQMTTSYQDIPNVLEKLREENKSAKKSLKQARQELAAYQSQALWQAVKAQSPTDTVIVQHIFSDDYNPADLQDMVSQLTQNPATIALLASHGATAHLVFGRSEDLATDMPTLLKHALSILGSQRGGGRPSLAQGGGIPATPDQIQAALASVRQQL